jgi:hypothetical protein
VKYVILIHANPDPWGHPSSRYTPEGRALPAEQHDERAARRDGPAVRGAAGEALGLGGVVTAEALADPASATIYGWSPQGHLATDGPYAEAKEQLAGFFLIDCASRERAEVIAAQFAQPGGTVELRPVMWPGGDDQ